MEIKKIELFLSKVSDIICANVDLEFINTEEQFKSFVVEIMQSIKSEFNIEYLKYTGKQEFPNVILDNGFGVEIKYTKQNKWHTTGNSIFEKITDNELSNQLFVFFGSKQKNNRIEVKIKKYEECIADIRVTHSPRFYLDMDIDSGNSILSEMGETYETFKKLNNIEKSKRLKRQVRKNLNKGEILWWLDEEKSMKVKVYSEVDWIEKKKLLIKTFILFPNVFEKNNIKYEKISLYWLNKYNIFNASIRDVFSAGGKVSIKECREKQSKIIALLSENYDDIISFLKNDEIDIEELIFYWKYEFDFPIEIWQMDDPEYRAATWKRIILSNLRINIQRKEKNIESKNPPLLKDLKQLTVLESEYIVIKKIFNN
ncbi:hypothetical protein ACFSY7_11650 [Kurthia populi]|uniref:Restriction endonuclease n=1 Tax=Kurthia populi TaxID=1562132 RepID=A0ABW5Y1W6_9BACL